MEKGFTRIQRRMKAKEASREKKKRRGLATLKVIWMWERAKALFQSLLEFLAENL